MGFITLPYCNNSLGKTVVIIYNDLTHSIQSHQVTVTNCNTPQPAQLYEQINPTGTAKWVVVPNNVAPYAAVFNVPIYPCNVNINSVTVGNASLDTASNGTLTINATGNGLLYYSLDDIEYSPSNLRTGLAPGNYRVWVLNIVSTPLGNVTCKTFQDVVVGFNAIDCATLALGTPNFTGPTSSGGSDGSITATLESALHPVEFRIGTGAWQSSSLFTGLAAGTYSVQVRYVGTTCVDSQNVTLTDLISCDITILNVSVTHEQSRFGDNGSILIEASSAVTPIEYSKDNGSTWQDENEFSNLEPGTYNLCVRDANLCVACTTVELFAFKNLFLRWPRPNSFRAVITSGPLYEPVQNFDNRLFADMRFPGVTPCRYAEKTERNTQRLQWLSSYNTHVVKLYDQANTLIDTLTAFLAKQYLAQTDTIDDVVLYNAGGGQAQVVFPGGIPNYLQIGQTITLSGSAHAILNASFEVKDIRPGTLLATGNAVAVFDVVWPTGNVPVSADYASVYDIEPYNVWEVSVAWDSYDNGEYYMVIECSDPQFFESRLTTEPIDLQTAVDDLVKIVFKNTESAFEVDYTTGIEHVLYLDGELKHPEHGGERTLMNDPERRLIKLQEYVTRKPLLVVHGIPYHLAERIILALAHDSKVINGVVYEIEDQPTVTHYDMDAFCSLQARLREVDYMADNSDDRGTVDNPVTVLEVNGVLLRLNP